MTKFEKRKYYRNGKTCFFGRVGILAGKYFLVGSSTTPVTFSDGSFCYDWVQDYLGLSDDDATYLDSIHRTLDEIENWIDDHEPFDRGVNESEFAIYHNGKAITYYDNKDLAIAFARGLRQGLYLYRGSGEITIEQEFTPVTRPSIRIVF